MLRKTLIPLILFGCGQPATEGAQTRTDPIAVALPNGPPPPLPPVFGRINDPANCIDWGRLTYENTMKDRFADHCVGCHAPKHGDHAVGEAWAVAPPNDWLHLSRWDGVVDASIGYLCHKVAAQEMPPPQSQPALSDSELKDFEIWCADHDDAVADPLIPDAAEYARGSAIPQMNLLAVRTVCPPPDRDRLRGRRS